nr:hypothetical protein GCM10020185_01490 [Pseudomonas brassicacearum subsp. brassicacearum]
MLADIDGLQVVGQAESGEESLIKARELKPDVVLMDVKMPGIGGLEATRKLLRSHPDIKVVAVTVCEEDPFPTRLLQAGAAGYLTKGAGLNEMVQAIRLVFLPGNATSARKSPSNWRSSRSSQPTILPSMHCRSGKSRLR